MTNDAALHHHPDLARRARFLPRVSVRRWSLPLVRLATRAMGHVAATGGEVVDLGECRVFVHRPSPSTDTAAPALLWIHGGGLVLGDARQDDPFLARFVNELGMVVVAVDYRLAPEHPFPAPLDDCLAAFDWLSNQHDVDERRLVVGGASAGGGLAAALCQRLVDRGAAQPSFQLLVYPMLDDRSSTSTTPQDRHLRLWDRRSNEFGWSSYLAGHDRDAPPAFAVPARTPELRGLPPAWIGVGTLDLFHDEDLAYASRLRAAGSPAEVEIVDGAYHGFDGADPGAAVSRRFRDSQVAAVASHLGPRSPTPQQHPGTTPSADP